MSKPHIWMISASYYPHIGGGEQQLQRLSEQLIPKGWHLNIITRRQSKWYPYTPVAFEHIQGVPVHRVPSQGKGPFGSLCFLVFAILFLARNHRSKNIYHAHGIGTPAWIAILSRYLFGGKAVILLRTGIEQYAVRRESRLGRLSLDLQLKLADRIIILNRSLIEELQLWGVSKERIFFFPNCIDTDMFHPPSKTPNTEASSKGIFIYIGRLSYWKGVDILIDAWAKFASALEDSSELWIVGDGPDRQDLETQANDLNVIKSIRFMGKREDVVNLLQQSNVLVLPSRTEGLSNAMIEGMACGLPVVCTAVGGSPDWVIPGKNGLLVAPENPDGLGYALAFMVENRSKWGCMGAYGRKTIEDHMDWKSQISRMENFYLQLQAQASQKPFTKSQKNR